MTFATESTRWYDPSTAQAVGEVVGKNGKARPPTLRDAKTQGYVKSVTSVLRSAAAPALEQWKRQQILYAALTLPRLPDEPLDDFILRVEQDAAEQAKNAREAGSEVHGAIQRHCQGLPVDDRWLPHIAALGAALEAYGIKLTHGQSERVFVTDRYGGCVDWADDRFVLDFKTKPAITPEVKAYDEHGLQLVAYDQGMGNGPRRLLNVFIGINDAQVKAVEWDAGQRPRLETMWDSLLAYTLAKDRLL
jgi:hypothetical protein